MLCVVVLTAGAVVLGVIGSLRLRAVREAIVTRVSVKLETSAGITLRALDFDLDLWSGDLEIAGIELAAPRERSRPFFTAASVRVALDLRSLVRGRLIVHDLQVDRPRWLLGVPLPSRPPTESRAPNERDLPVVIRSFEIRGGEVDSGKVPAPADAWLEGWRLSDATGRGSFADGRVEAELSRAVLHILRRGVAPLEVDVGASLAFDTDGGIEVRSITARGPGIALDARGKGSAVSGGGFDGSYGLRADLGRLIPDLVSRGTIAASGTLEGSLGGDRGPMGRVRLDVRDFPGDLAQPWLPSGLPPILTPTGTSVDVAGDLGFDLAADALEGQASIAWRRDRTPLLEASVHSGPEVPPSAGEAARWSIEATLLPAADGERRARATLRFDSWRDLASAEILDARLDVREPDPSAAFARLGARLPWYGEAAPPGEVEAVVEAQGLVTAPQLTLDATWRDDDGTLAAVAARTPPAGSVRRRGGFPVDFEASLLPGTPGTRKVSGRLDGLVLADTTVRIDTPDLGASLSEVSRRMGIELPAEGHRLEEILPGRFETTAALSGPVREPRVSLEAAWHPTDGSTVRVAASGTPTGSFPFVKLERAATLEVRDLDVSRLGLRGLTIDHLEASSDGVHVDVARLEATFPALPTGGVRGKIEGRGRFDLAWPPRRAEADLGVEHPVEDLERVTARLRLEDEILFVDRLEAEAGGTCSVARGSIPLSAMAPYGGPLRDLLAGYEPGPVQVEVEGVELGTLRPFLSLPEGAPVLGGTVDAKVSIDVDELSSSSGFLEVRALSVTLDNRRLDTEEPLRIDLGGGRLLLPLTRLRATGPETPAGLVAEVSGSIDLAPGWHVEEGFASLVRDFSLDLHGMMEMAVLARLLRSGTAAGSIRVDATAKGPLDGMTAQVRISGPDARISWSPPYATRLMSPEIEMTARDGTLVLESARARWNDGDLKLRGTASAKGDSRLHGDFSGVTYRLDYGVTTKIGGHLELVLPAEGRRALRGEIDIDRAALRRNVVLDRELLRAILEPEVTGDHPLVETIELDVAVTTDQGLVIKNNVADLHADWDRLVVTGTLAAPRLDGRVRLEPGGLVNLLGNILRIDEGTVSWSGDPPGSPRIALKTTSSIDDPTIETQWYNAWYGPALRGPGEGGAMDLRAPRASSDEVMDAFATGVMTYYQDRVAGAVSGGVTETQLSYRPLPLLGETDTAARMTLSQRISSNATFIASTSPTDAEAQTFIVDVHALGFAPSLTAQFFTNDEKNEGITLQQTLRLGAGPPDADASRRLRKIRVESPKGVPKRRLKRSMTYRSGDPLPDGSRLDVEFDVVDAMRRRGYPLAEVEVEEVPSSRKGVDLAVRVSPGPKIRSKFDGDRPSSAARRAIAALYRYGDEEAGSLEEIRQETVRALQDRGYLSPRVEVSVERVEGSGGPAPVTLLVRAEGGRKVDPGNPEFLGVDPEEAATLAPLFVSRFARILLATGAPTADQRVVRTLGAAGYPSAKVASRELSEDGRSLLVRVVPGERRRLASVRLEGVSQDEEKRLTPLLTVREGDPARADRIARSIAAIEREMRRTGHAGTNVKAELKPVSSDKPLDLTLVFEVAPGPVFTIGEVQFDGLGKSNPGWVRGLAGLSTGEVADPDEISKSRAQLARTGVFQTIRVSTDPKLETTSRAGLPDTAEVPTAIRFDLTERQRWQLAYGGRYETDQGLGGIVDLYNFNSLGRGHTTGVRAVYSEDEARFRLYHVIPGLFGERSSLEGFAEWKQELIDDVESEGVEGWLQVALPLNKRWQTRVYTVLEHRDLSEESVDPDAPLDERVISPRLGWQLAYDSRVLPPGGRGRERGFFYGVNLIGSSGVLGSDLEGLGTFQQWSHFLPLGSREHGRLTWAHSYRVNTINTKDAEVPFDNRLRAGGEFSVRGYPTNSLGPLDEEGNALGGEVLFLLNEELHTRIGRTWSGLLFFDAGNVWPTLHDVEGRLFKSWGAGLRWFSPVGPLRLDYARPLDRRTDDADYQIYFGFGNVF